MDSNFCDNTSVMNMAKNIVRHKRIKYIDVRHHFFENTMNWRHIFMEFCKIEEQIANIFIKASSRDHFGRNRL